MKSIRSVLQILALATLVISSTAKAQDADKAKLIEIEKALAANANPGEKAAALAKQDFYGFGPRPVDLFLADGFVAVAEVQTNESHQLSEIVLGGGLSQIRNGHGSLPLIRREDFVAETTVDANTTEKLPYRVDGLHSRKMAGSLRELLLDGGNLTLFRGKSGRKHRESLFVGELSGDPASRIHETG